MKRALTLTICVALVYNYAMAQSLTIQPISSVFKTSAISINSDGSLPKSKLHIKGVGSVPTVTQTNTSVYTSIATEAIPASVNSEVYSIYAYGTNSQIQNTGMMGHVGNTCLFNIGIFGLAQDDGSGDNFALKTFAKNNGTGAAFGIFGSGYGDAPARAVYGIYGEAYGTTALKYAGYFDGNVTVTGTFTQPSDEKFKTNIKQMSNSLGLVMQLNPSTYQYVSAEAAGVTLPTGRHQGFIAQDFQKIFPDLVVTNTQPARYNAITKAKIADEQSYLSINYIELLPVLVKAIQEQQTQIESLKNEITALKNK